MAFLTLTIRVPPVGVFEETHLPSLSWLETIKTLAKNRTYVVVVMGYIANTFAIGGIADWMPTYLHRVVGIDIAEAGTIVGAATVVGGIVGTLFGGWWGDFMRMKTRQPYFAVSSLSTAIATIGAIICLLLRPLWSVTLLLILLQFFLWCFSGPVNAIIANSVPSNIRTRAFSVSILSIHLLGDAISPMIIGKISDVSGSLSSAVSILPVALGVSAIIWGIGWRTLPEKSLHSILQDEDLDQMVESVELVEEDQFSIE